MTDDQALDIISRLASAYPSVTLDAQRVTVYTEMLLELPYKQTLIAAKTLIARSKFFPTIAEIFEVLLNLENQIPSAAEAWEEVAKEIRACGTWKSPTWSNAVIKRAVQTLGWYNLCTSENSTTDRAHFLRIYSELAQVERNQEGRMLLRQGADWGLLHEPTE